MNRDRVFGTHTGDDQLLRARCPAKSMPAVCHTHIKIASTDPHQPADIFVSHQDLLCVRC
jgi:hypothetical protein